MPEENDTERLVRRAALDAGTVGLRALDLDQTQVEGGTRVSVCVDSLGLRTDERFGRYSTGSSIGPGSLTDSQISDFVERLGDGGAVMQDSMSDLDGTRSVRVLLPINGLEVSVDVVREADGSATLATVTLCEP